MGKKDLYYAKWLLNQKHEQGEHFPRTQALQVICEQHTPFTYVRTPLVKITQNIIRIVDELCKATFGNKQNKFYEEVL